MKQLVLHCHHRLLFETLTEPLRNRIKYIKEEKPEHEVETRLGAIRILTPAEVKTIPKGVMKKLEAYDGVRHGERIIRHGKRVIRHGKRGVRHGKFSVKPVIHPL